MSDEDDQEFNQHAAARGITPDQAREYAKKVIPKPRESDDPKDKKKKQ